MLAFQVIKSQTYSCPSLSTKQIKSNVIQRRLFPFSSNQMSLEIQKVPMYRLKDNQLLSVIVHNLLEGVLSQPSYVSLVCKLILVPRPPSSKQQHQRFFSPLSSPTETSDGGVPLHRASGEQQLQHLPLQEVPKHVRGAEADWPVQAREQIWTGSEGHSLSPHVRKVLIGGPYWEILMS